MITISRAAASGSRFAGLRAASARARGDAPAKPKAAAHAPAPKPSATADALARRQAEVAAPVIAAVLGQGSTGTARSTSNGARPSMTDAERRAAADDVWDRARAAARPAGSTGR